MGNTEARFYRNRPAYYHYSNNFNHRNNYWQDRQDEENEEDKEDEEDEKDEKDEENKIVKLTDPKPMEWVQLSILGLAAFGFAILGAQLAFGLTNPLHFPNVFPYPRRASRSLNEYQNFTFGNLFSTVLKRYENAR